MKPYFAILDFSIVSWVKGEGFGSYSYKLFCEEKTIEINLLAALKFTASSLILISWWCMQLLSIADPIESNLSPRTKLWKLTLGQCFWVYASMCYRNCKPGKVTTKQYKNLTYHLGFYFRLLLECEDQVWSHFYSLYREELIEKVLKGRKDCRDLDLLIVVKAHLRTGLWSFNKVRPHSHYRYINEISYQWYSLLLLHAGYLS